MRIQNSIFLLLIVTLLTSCSGVGSFTGTTFQKRKYRAGWYTNNNCLHRSELVSKDTCSQKLHLSENCTTVFSNDLESAATNSTSTDFLNAEKPDIKQRKTDSSDSSREVAETPADQSKPLHDGHNAVASCKVEPRTLYTDGDSNNIRETHTPQIVETPWHRDYDTPPQGEDQGENEALRWMLLIVGILFVVAGAFVAVGLIMLGGGIYILIGVLPVCIGALMITLFIIHGQKMMPKRKKTRLTSSLTLVIFLLVGALLGLFWMAGKEIG